MSLNSRIEQASKIVSEKLGLFFPENRYQDLSSGIISASDELGFSNDGETFLTLLLEQKLSTKQLDILAEKLTIGETYFFREPQILDVFREMIIPSLIHERENTTRSIRIWSAGCCSGEEPFTLAMILCEILPNIDTWDISILATDINRRFLDKASKGKYTQWSFRDTPENIKKKYFTSSGTQFEISQKIRRMVTFAPLNLVEDAFPADRNNTTSMDVIFCRNVLMYFTPEIAKKVGEKFYQSLSENGWFITSQVELSDDLFHLLNKVNYRNSFLYRKTKKAVGNHRRSRQSEIIKPTKATTTKRHKLKTGKAEFVHRRKAELPADSHQTSNNQITKLLGNTRDYANKGDYENAFKWAEQLIEADPSNPEGYYYKGMILFETGKLEMAGQQFKKALYLNPEHLLSHFQMAAFCLRTGNEKQARKHKQNVTNLLQKIPDDTLIPGTDGMTAANLKSLLQPLNMQQHD
jgi:chemotaxis protein methyltransferase CheR